MAEAVAIRSRARVSFISDGEVGLGVCISGCIRLVSYGRFFLRTNELSTLYRLFKYIILLRVNKLLC